MLFSESTREVWFRKEENAKEYCDLNGTRFRGHITAHTLHAGIKSFYVSERAIAADYHPEKEKFPKDRW